MTFGQLKQNFDEEIGQYIMVKSYYNGRAAQSFKKFDLKVTLNRTEYHEVMSKHFSDKSFTLVDEPEYGIDQDQENNQLENEKVEFDLICDKEMPLVVES